MTNCYQLVTYLSVEWMDEKTGSGRMRRNIVGWIAVVVLVVLVVGGVGVENGVLI